MTEYFLAGGLCWTWSEAGKTGGSKPPPYKPPKTMPQPRPVCTILQSTCHSEPRSGEESREQDTEATEYGILHFVQDDRWYVILRRKPEESHYNHVILRSETTKNLLSEILRIRSGWQILVKFNNSTSFWRSLRLKNLFIPTSFWGMKWRRISSINSKIRR